MKIHWSNIFFFEFLLIFHEMKIKYIYHTYIQDYCHICTLKSTYIQLKGCKII